METALRQRLERQREAPAVAGGTNHLRGAEIGSGSLHHQLSPQVVRRIPMSGRKIGLRMQGQPDHIGGDPFLLIVGNPAERSLLQVQRTRRRHGTRPIEDHQGRQALGVAQRLKLRQTPTGPIETTGLEQHQRLRQRRGHHQMRCHKTGALRGFNDPVVDVTHQRSDTLAGVHLNPLSQKLRHRMHPIHATIARVPSTPAQRARCGTIRDHLRQPCRWRKTRIPHREKLRAMVWPRTGHGALTDVPTPRPLSICAGCGQRAASSVAGGNVPAPIINTSVRSGHGLSAVSSACRSVGCATGTGRASRDRHRYRKARSGAISPNSPATARPAPAAT